MSGLLSESFSAATSRSASSIVGGGTLIGAYDSMDAAPIGSPIGTTDNESLYRITAALAASHAESPSPKSRTVAPRASCSAAVTSHT